MSIQKYIVAFYYIKLGSWGSQFSHTEISHSLKGQSNNNNNKAVAHNCFGKLLGDGAGALKSPTEI